jgi:hypothetical protein
MLAETDVKQFSETISEFKAPVSAAEEAGFCPFPRHPLLAFWAHKTLFTDGAAGFAEKFQHFGAVSGLLEEGGDHLVDEGENFGGVFYGG